MDECVANFNLHGIAIFSTCVVLSCLCLAPNAVAQDATIIRPGNKAVTGFSGTYIPRVEEGFPAGVDPLDETFIDPAQATLRIFDVSQLGGPAEGQLVFTPPPFEVTAAQIGQVFGLAYDDGRGFDGTAPVGSVPNLYATATSLLGIQIVENDVDNDGRPERLRRGKPGARFMDGQFGPTTSGPGTIWKIDGATGAVSVFAKIENNSGAALGNIAFDKRHRQFFVSNVDDGVIYRIAMDGTIVETFDHGDTGLAAVGMAPILDDWSRTEIEDPAFDSADPATWGYTQNERRVWGVGVLRGRLYYAVGSSDAQVWSVGIGRDGSFLGDARWELDVAGARDYAVTDIAFDGNGFMYLAQRGPVENTYDYSSFARSGQGEVLRYYRESPDDPATPGIWGGPDTYATGLLNGYQQTAGGLDLEYGYLDDGRIDVSRCEATLFATGDNLMGDPSLAGSGVTTVSQTAPLIVHGTQLTDKNLTRPDNEPPFFSWYFDFDGFLDDPEVRGHVGDVEVWRPCAQRPGNRPGYGQWSYHQTNVSATPDVCLKPEDVFFECDPNGDLIADAYFGPSGLAGANTLRSQTLTPGISLWPGEQTRSTSEHPFSFWLSNTYPGDRVRLDLCLSDVENPQPGVAYPCCRGSIEVQVPDFVCR